MIFQSGIGLPADATVTNAKLANMAQSTIKGRAAGAGTGVPVDLTVAQVQAILSLPTSTTDNAVIRADGTAGGHQNSAFIIDDSGNVTSFGGQFAFPANQNASANANTLDDYEEGTFTPTMTFNASATGVTYSSQTGFYVKIGQFVLAFGRITLTSNGSGVGNARIASMPFANGILTTVTQPQLRLLAGGSAATGVFPSIESGSSTALLIIPGAVSGTAATDTNITDTFSADYLFTYQAAA